MNQRGEIAQTITVFAVILMTAGVLIGSVLTTRTQLASTASNAQTGPSNTPAPSPTPSDPKTCPQLAGKVPDAVVADAMTNPSKISGWNELNNPNQPESATNKRKISLTLKDINLAYNTTINPLVFAAECKNLAQPGKLTVRVTFNNTSFTGPFDELDYTTEMCDLDESKFTGVFKGETKNCAVAPNQKATHDLKKPTTQPFTQTLTDSFTSVPGGKKVIRLPYGFWRQFGTPDARKDVSGVLITFGGSVCEGKVERGSVPSCLMTLDGDATLDVVVTLPDLTKHTYRLGFKDEVSGCNIATDGTSDVSRPGTPCSGTYNKQQDLLTIEYAQASTSAKTLQWEVVRCNGDAASNRSTCTKNDIADEKIDVRNFFSEAAPSEQIKKDFKRICTLHPAAYPLTQENQTKVTEIVRCEIAPMTSPTMTPAPTSGASPTPIPDNYNAVMSVYNSASTNVVKVFTTACPNGTNCVEDVETTEIKPGARKLVEVNLGNISQQTQFFTIKIAVQLAGSSAKQQLPQELNVTKLQSVFYNLKATDTALSGTAKTEVEASDVSGNACVNADDASRVIKNLAFVSATDVCSPEDINCDGIVNTLDLGIIISNLSNGAGCALNR